MAYAALRAAGLTRTLFAPPRMRTADTISNTPMTIRQTPTAMANVTIDGNGTASTIIPASKLRMPKKICQPRPGPVGWLIAATVVGKPLNGAAIGLDAQMVGHRGSQARIGGA